MSDGFTRVARGSQGASCDGKERFESFSLARRVSKRRTRKGRTGEPYRCGHCHGIHLGLAFGDKSQRAEHRRRRREEA